MREVGAESGRPSAFRPLAGVRVVEFSQLVMGPTCGLILADLGADVVKVESPSGDPYRSYQGGQFSPHFQAYNRNKRSIVLDMNADSDRAVFDDLVRRDQTWAFDPRLNLRYNAACAATLAGTGRGRDAPPPEGRAALRRQALEWLRADLTAYRRGFDPAWPRAAVERVLDHWLTDPDLTLVYLPHLDYDYQRRGPGDAACLRDVDACAGVVLAAAREIDARVIVVSCLRSALSMRSVPSATAFSRCSWRSR